MAVVPAARMFVLVAGMLPAGMHMLMVRAAYIRVIAQCAVQIGARGIVRLPGYATEQLNPSFRQGHLRAAADSAANQNIDFCLRQKACQRTMSLPIGIDDLGADNLTIFCIIQFEEF